MSHQLWDTTWKVGAGALGLAIAASAVFILTGRPLDGAGLLCGALISIVNFRATSRFLGRVSQQARREADAYGGRRPEAGPAFEAQESRRVAASNRAAFGFILRYLAIGVLLVLLILVVGLPPATTVLGVAAVPLTIYLWQISRLLTGKWKEPIG
jgi:hypothetical protein